MNKAELIKALAEKTNGTQAEAKAFLEAFTDVVGDVLKKGVMCQMALLAIYGFN